MRSEHKEGKQFKQDRLDFLLSCMLVCAFRDMLSAHVVAQNESVLVQVLSSSILHVCVLPGGGLNWFHFY